MVIEREIGLRTYIESGVPLDAQLSYDLLATIFRPSAPLHDGAVIIQKDRIAAAACFLPLSMNPVLSTQLGTRHRAGIGVTEETDAIAVVVSEETGASAWRSAEKSNATSPSNSCVIAWASCCAITCGRPRSPPQSAMACHATRKRKPYAPAPLTRGSTREPTVSR